MTKKQVADRFEKIAYELHIDQATIYKKLNSNSATVSNVFTGKNFPSFSFLLKFLSTYKKINARWLITGEGSMFTEQINKVSEERVEYKLDVEARLTRIENYLKQRDENFKP